MRKSRALIAGIAIICVLLCFLAYFLRARYVVPIIMYHSVNPDASLKNGLEVPVKTFARQMRFLKDRHYNVLNLETLADLIKNKKKIPPRTLAITFDDGYKDSYMYAFPILEKYNLPATMFVIVNEVGRAENDRLSWGQIKTMQDSGIITIGSHALGPEPLTKITSAEDVKKEIFDSKKVLEGKLGREVRVFSYPEGRFNRQIRQLVIDAGYKLAVATRPGRAYPDEDIFALKRLRISANSDNLFIFWFETSGFYTFLKERHHAK